MNTEQERAEFEALERNRKGFGPDTLTRATIEPDDEYLLPLVQARWEGYQAGRAALQSESTEIYSTIRGDSYAGVYVWCGDDNVLQHFPKEIVETVHDKQSALAFTVENAIHSMRKLVSQSQDAERYRAWRKATASNNYDFLKRLSDKLPDWDEGPMDESKIDESIDHARRVEGGGE